MGCIMNKLLIRLLIGGTLSSSAALMALDASQASALISDVQEIKRDVKQLLAQQRGGGGSGSGAAASVRPPKTPAQLAQELPEVIKEATRDTGTRAQFPVHLAKLVRDGVDLNYSRSGGAFRDTALWAAVFHDQSREIQKQLWDAGARLNPAEIKSIKENLHADHMHFLDKRPILKEIGDYVAAS